MSVLQTHVEACPFQLFNLVWDQILREDADLHSFKVNRGTSFSLVFLDAHRRHGLYAVATLMLVFMTAFLITFLHHLTKSGTTGLLLQYFYININQLLNLWVAYVQTVQI